MIPIKLTLNNFMCFRDNIPPINFESIHTACISGNNGNGKSALIDAMTWALWGQSRATSDDELIHTGQNEVTVEFEFAVGTQRYRIIRKHSRPKTQSRSGQTILEFQVSSADCFKPLTGDNITQTQQKINQILHMDYDTFINSAFLKQGRADEFTKKRPGERKQVLANILQLSVYDDLEEQARNISKERENEALQLDNAIRAIQDELAQKGLLQTQLEQAELELSAVEKLIKDLETSIAGLRKDKQNLESRKVQLAELSAHAGEAQRNLNLWNEQLDGHRSRILEYEQVIGSQSTIDEHYNLLVDSRKTCLEQDQKLKQVSSFKERKHRLEMSMVKAEESLIARHAVSANKIRELETTLLKLPQLQTEIQQVSGQLDQMIGAETRLRDRKEKSKDLKSRAQFLQAENTRLTLEIEQIGEKLKMLCSGTGVACPLCETELGLEGQKRVESKYLADTKIKTEAFRSNQTEYGLNEAACRSLETEIASTESMINRNKANLQNKQGVLSKEIADAKEAAEKVEEERLRLAEIEDHLAKRDFAASEQAVMNEIEKEIQSIAYDSQKHEQLRSQISDLEKYEQPKRKLDEAARLIVSERDAAGIAQTTVLQLNQKQAENNQRRQVLLDQINAFPTLASDLTQAENKFQAFSGQQRKAQETLGGVKARLARLTELEEQSKEKVRHLSEIGKQEKIFKDLAQAFGKKGIQSMLIEMAIPEIEVEANRLLARMTDNRMHVKMETQRGTRKGDVVETLDINISDELGTRNYEMFSGGEAFRIDFAIRIALSRLLARRAGAPLPTLIIDEGFGTQDSTGIEKIKEAIGSIQDDFEKILVISHISDFKDAFPMRIEVVKTPEGSSVFLT